MEDFVTSHFKKADMQQIECGKFWPCQGSKLHNAWKMFCLNTMAQSIDLLSFWVCSIQRDANNSEILTKHLSHRLYASVELLLGATISILPRICQNSSYVFQFLLYEISGFQEGLV